MTDPLVDVLAEALIGYMFAPGKQNLAAGDAVAALDANPDLVLARLVERGVLRELEPERFAGPAHVEGMGNGEGRDWQVWLRTGDRLFVAQQEPTPPTPRENEVALRNFITDVRLEVGMSRRPVGQSVPPRRMQANMLAVSIVNEFARGGKIHPEAEIHAKEHEAGHGCDGWGCGWACVPVDEGDEG